MKPEGLIEVRLCRAINILALCMSPSSGIKYNFNRSLFYLFIYLFIYLLAHLELPQRLGE